MLYKNYEILIERSPRRYYAWCANIYDGKDWYWVLRNGCSAKHVYDEAKSIIDLYEKYPNYYPSM